MLCPCDCSAILHEEAATRDGLLLFELWRAIMPALDVPRDAALLPPQVAQVRLLLLSANLIATLMRPGFLSSLLLELYHRPPFLFQPSLRYQRV